MAYFLLIRHGKTQGNIERRYIGDPEEPLCTEGIQEIEGLARSGALPYADTLISGYALRCRQTAELLFPDKAYTLCPLHEIDFGIFKGKNADDLLGDTAYNTWLETNCMGDIPGGDSVTAFKESCCDAFRGIMEEHTEGTTALIIHGGNIMAILERFAMPRRDFYDYYVPNCGYFLCRWEHGALVIERTST